MFRSRWTPEKVSVLVERFADTRNADLAAELGVGVRTVCRKAAELGLRKSEEFMRRSREAGLREVEYMRIAGTMPKREGNFRRTPGSFRKGHRFCREIEERRVKALRDRAWDERVREIRGWRRNTGWKLRKF